MAKKPGKAVSKRKSKTTAGKKVAVKTNASKQAASKSAKIQKQSIRTGAPRRPKPPKRKFWQLRKPIKHPVKLPNIWQLTKTAAETLWLHRRLFIGITLVYGLLNLVLVKGLASSTDVGGLKTQLSQAFHGDFGSLASGLSIFVVLVGSAGNGSSQTAGAYQLFLAIMASLAIIWALRQVLAGTAIRVRDAYYRGMYPLVPFILVLLVVGLQLIPLLIGSAFYGLVVSGGIATSIIEKLICVSLFALLALWSLYMVSSSLFALYIVTLPDMTPRRALRSAKELVRHRRWTVLRKILCLPVILLLAAAIIMLPIIIWLTPLAQWIFFVLTMFAVAAVQAYMYTLYRELLNE